MPNKSGEFVIPPSTQVVGPVIPSKGLKVDISCRGREPDPTYTRSTSSSSGIVLRGISDYLAPGARRTLEVEPGQQSFYRMF